VISVFGGSLVCSPDLGFLGLDQVLKDSSGDIFRSPKISRLDLVGDQDLDA